MSSPEPKSSAELFPGYAVPAGSYTAPRMHRTSYLRLLRTWGIGIAVVAAALVGVTMLVHQASARATSARPTAGSRRWAHRSQINPRFTAPDGAFSVSYPAEGAAYKITTDANGVTADFAGGDGGTLQLFSQPAAGRTPEEIATALVNETFPDTRTAYEIPNAMVGYQPGYGLVADCWPQGANSNYMRMRVIVMVAVKNDLALVAGCGRSLSRVRPGLRVGQAVGSQPAARAGYGQVRQQLQLARRPAAVTVTPTRWCRAACW